MKNIIYVLTIVSLLWCTSASAQTNGSITGVSQDEFVVNNDASNNWSGLRLQTSNNQGWTMLNKNGFSWFYAAGANFSDRGEADGARMSLSTAGNLNIMGTMGTNGLTITGGNVLEFGYGIAGKGAYSGKIGYKTWSDGLDIVGASQGSDGRKITMYADGGMTVHGYAHYDGSIDASDLTVNSNGTLQMGAGISGRETNAGKIVYQGFSDGLDILGAGTTTGNRKIVLYSEGGMQVWGNTNVNGQIITSGGMTSSGLRINGLNSVELGYGVAGKTPASGKIAYQAFSDALDIVGAGTLATNRKIKLWSEGGLTVVGPTTVAGGADMAGLVRIAPSGTTTFTTIGSGYAGDYLLWVEKGVVSEDVSIAPKGEWTGSIEKRKTIEDAHWADYVFSPSYKLPKLSHVEKYIADNHHLEGIPSASDIMMKGYSLADMDKNFVAKIEELTLYAIQQDKKIIQQDEKIAQMEKLLLELKAQLDKK